MWARKKYGRCKCNHMCFGLCQFLTLTFITVYFYMCRYSRNIKQLMTACFNTNPIPLCLQDFMRQVFKLEYTQEPNYSMLKGLFQKELKKLGSKDDPENLDWLTPSMKVKLEIMFRIRFRKSYTI